MRIRHRPPQVGAQDRPVTQIATASDILSTSRLFSAKLRGSKGLDTLASRFESRRFPLSNDTGRCVGDRVVQLTELIVRKVSPPLLQMLGGPSSFKSFASAA